MPKTGVAAVLAQAPLLGPEHHRAENLEGAISHARPQLVPDLPVASAKVGIDSARRFSDRGSHPSRASFRLAKALSLGFPCRKAIERRSERGGSDRSRLVGQVRGPGEVRDAPSLGTTGLGPPVGELDRRR